MSYRLAPVPEYCQVLIIDAEEERAQRFARLLALAHFRPIVTASPFQAMERALEGRLVPDAIVLGRLDPQQEFLLTRLVQRQLRDRAETVPLITMPPVIAAEPPIFADPYQPYMHAPSQTCEDTLAPIWRALPQTRSNLRAADHSLVLSVLPPQGFQPRVSTQLRSANSHLRQVIQSAFELLGEHRWRQLIADVGLAQYREPRDWPPDDDERAIPAEYLSLLHQAVVFANPDDPAGQLRRWSDLGTQASLGKHRSSALVQQALKLLSKEQLAGLVLKTYANEMNAIRGEDLHIWQQRPDGSFCLVHYSNLYVYGRTYQRQPSCHVWLASLEASLRVVNLDTAYEVVEMECSCQTLTGHCVFLIRPREDAPAPAQDVERSTATFGQPRTTRRFPAEQRQSTNPLHPPRPTGPIRGM